MILRIMFLCWALFVDCFFGLDCLAEELAVIEFRRTFAAPDCSQGEVFINGKIVGVFSSNPALFERHLEDRPFIGDEITLEGPISDAAPRIFGRVLGMRVSSANTPQNFRILLLEESSYSNYDRPRKKTREIPSDVIIIGSQRLDRECSIQASSRDRVLGYDSRYNSATNLVASALSKGVTNRNFPAGLKIAAITFLSDSSGPADIILGTIVFSKRQPREALNIVDGDTCLLPVEHMKNRFIQRGGEKTYRRTDDIWFCTDGLLTGGADAAAIAGNIDIRYFEIASREICASVLGIPVSRSYIVYRDNEGNPGSAWTRCLGTEDWKKVTDKAIIKEHDSK